MNNESGVNSGNGYDYSKAMLQQNKQKNAADIAGSIASAGSPLLYKTISDGLSSKGGEIVSNAGTIAGAGLTAASALGMVNPLVGVGVALGSALLGGIGNRLWGYKLNQGNINNVKSNIDLMNSYRSNVGDYDSLAQNALNAPSPLAFNKRYLGKAGIRSGKINRLYDSLNTQQDLAFQNVQQQNKNNAYNINMNQGLTARNLSFALGGQMGQPISGALDYAMATDMLNQRAFENQNKMAPVVFAFGGTKPKSSSHGADFTNGVTFVNNGGTHEDNAYGGVTIGMDPQGVPNQVEEGEVIYNDFVFSNRIQVPNEVKEALGLRGKNITFAKAAKQIQKESEERPNDPISKRGLETAMGALAQAQEQYKQQQMAMQQQAQQMVAQQVAQEQQLQQEQQMQQASPMDALMGAYGGLLANRYPIGGTVSKWFNGLPEARYDELIKNVNWNGITPPQFNDRQELIDYINKQNIIPAINSIKRSFIADPVNAARMKFTSGFTDGFKNGTISGYYPLIENPKYVLSGAADGTSALDKLLQNDAYLNKDEYGIMQGANVKFNSPRPQTAFGDFQAAAQALPFTGSGISGRAKPMGAALQEPQGMARAAAKRNRNANTAGTGFTWPGLEDNVVEYINGLDDTGEQPIVDEATRQQALIDDYISQGIINPELLDQYERSNVNLRGLTLGEALDRMGINTNAFQYATRLLEPLNLDQPFSYDYLSDPEDAVLAEKMPAGPSTKSIKEAYKNVELGDQTYKDSWLMGLRWAPVIGGGINVLSDLFGLTNKADYSNADSIINAATSNLRQVKAPQLGNYMSPYKFDRLFHLIPLLKEAGRGVSAIQNNAAGNVGAANAAIVSLIKNAQEQSANLERQGEEFNRADEFKVAEYNKDTDKTNATLALEAQAANNQSASAKVQAAAQAAAIRDAVDQRLGAARTLNLTNFFNSLGNVGLDAINQRDRDLLLYAGVYGKLPNWWRPYGMTQDNWRTLRNSSRQNSNKNKGES